MHVRTGSSKLNPSHKKPSVDKSRRSTSTNDMPGETTPAPDQNAAAAEVVAGLNKATVKKAGNPP